MNEAIMLWMAGLGAAMLGLPRAHRRLQLSRAKHPSLAGHSRMAKRLARLMPGYSYSEEQFFNADDAPDEVVARRRRGLAALEAEFQQRFPLSLAASREASPQISDMQLTAAYRVPFPFSRHLRSRITLPSFLAAADGVDVVDLDGNRFMDLAGSYGVNLFGHDFYKACMAEGSRRADALGVMLGAYHPSVLRNVAALRRISGLDEVSFHMSGTEAVMQAVRLARYHTRKPYLVRFCGAYHGWWEDVQPGLGNPLPPNKTYTLRDMDDRSLRVLASRNDIACVLVNPLQAMHPNRNAPGDSALVDSTRCAHFDRAAYRDWLQKLRKVCDERGIVLIMDEVFLGFRLAPGGAQEYFDVRADLVTYGKTVGGGFPVGVVCGRAALMKRYREERPADICFARGTFNAHPHVMAAMEAFFERLAHPATQALYANLDERWNQRARLMNERLTAAGLPLQVSNLSTVWTVLFTRPSRYNWMLQFYLRREGLWLSWVGTGRLIFSLAYDDRQFDEMVTRFIRAGAAMLEDGWWRIDGGPDNRQIRRRILGESLRTWLKERI